MNMNINELFNRTEAPSFEWELQERIYDPDLGAGVHSTEVVEKYVQEYGDDAYISFTSIDKIGINPKTQYNTPIGIYAYPAKQIIDYMKSAFPEEKWKKHRIGEFVPFAGDNPWVNIITPKHPDDGLLVGMGEDYSEIDLKEDVQRMITWYESNAENRSHLPYRLTGVMLDNLDPKSSDNSDNLLYMRARGTVVEILKELTDTDEVLTFRDIDHMLSDSKVTINDEGSVIFQFKEELNITEKQYDALLEALQERDSNAGVTHRYPRYPFPLYTALKGNYDSGSRIIIPFEMNPNPFFGGYNDLDALKEQASKIIPHYSKAYQTGWLWGISHLFARRSEGVTHTIWNKILRFLGYEYIVDHGSGVIHENEPTQTIFLSKRYFDVIDRIENV